jgi:ribosomal RNA-processing protein 17
VSDEEWSGFGAGPSSPPREREDEYSDEEQLATVTVVEDFDPSTLLHGPERKADVEPGPDSGRADAPRVAPQPANAKGKERERAKKALKPKKVKYETKAARKTEQGKQRARRTEKAERAGGKASRKKGVPARRR